MGITAEIKLQIPPRSKCRWMKAVLGLQEWEMMGALGGISSKTLANWLADHDDKAALKSVEFQRLLEITQLARGVIRPAHLPDWMHEPSEEFGGLAPIDMLMRPDTGERVIAVLRELKYGNIA